MRKFIAHSYVNKLVIYSMNPNHLYNHNFMLLNKVKSMSIYSFFLTGFHYQALAKSDVPVSMDIAYI